MNKFYLLLIILCFTIEVNATLIKGECLGDAEQYFILKTADFSNLESKFKVLDTIWINNKKFEHEVECDSILYCSIFSSNNIDFNNEIILLKDDTLNLDILYKGNPKIKNNLSIELYFNKCKSKELNEFNILLNNQSKQLITQIFKEDSYAEFMHIIDSSYNFQNKYIECNDDKIDSDIIKKMNVLNNLHYENSKIDALIRLVFSNGDNYFQDTFDLSFIKNHRKYDNNLIKYSYIISINNILLNKIKKEEKSLDFSNLNESLSYKNNIKSIVNVVNIFEEYFENDELNYNTFIYLNYEINKIDNLISLNELKSYISSNNIYYKDTLSIILENRKQFMPKRKAPIFTIKDINGKIINIEDYKGKVIYIDFWFWGCPGCMLELENSKLLHNKYKDDNDIVFINISISHINSIISEKKKIEDLDIGGINIIDKEEIISSLYGIKSYPTYFLINKKGEIVSPNAPKPSSKSELYDIIDSELKKK